MISEPTVFLVDDDPAMLDSLRWLVESVGYKVEVFTSATAFLQAYTTDRLGCLVVDVRMPEMSGLELQERLVSGKITIPTIIISGHGDVPVAVRAMRAGAVDFIEKPFTDHVILDRIQVAVKRDLSLRETRMRRAELDELFSRLTPREREILGHVVTGKPNKEVAVIISRTEKTVEFHRAGIMRKMGMDSFAELVRVVHEYGSFEESEAEHASEETTGHDPGAQ